MTSARHPAATAIRAEAARVGWPLQFATDLDHDERAIATMTPNEPFTWCLYESGTHIGVTFDLYSNRSRLTMAMVAEAFGADRCMFYVWDGRALHAAASAAAADARLNDLARKLTAT